MGFPAETVEEQLGWMHSVATSWRQASHRMIHPNNGACRVRVGATVRVRV